jgi:hypothetical protein
MQNANAPDWYERELAQLQDLVTLLRRLLGAITLIGKAHEDTQRPGIGPSTPQSTPAMKRKIRYEH